MAIETQDKDRLREHEVRLFPVIRISSDREAELRATSALLAMVCAVSEFGRAVVKIAGAPAGKLSCYTEVSFEGVPSKGGEADSLRPDGVIHVVRGKKEWKALVEVKVGRNPLEQEQFTKYHRLARDAEFDALITISNQPAQANGLPPLSVDKRRQKKVPAMHFSWERLLGEAQMLSRKKEISDPDQKWMLDEWIRYVDDERSKIVEKPDLGNHWTDVLQAARQGALATTSHGLADVMEHWVGFIRKAALRLRAQLGVEVTPRLSRSDRSDPQGRLKRLTEIALKTGCLTGVLKVPRAVSDVAVDVLLQARTVRYRVSLDPPDEGRTKTRLNWLTRQLLKLDSAPSSLVLTVEWDRRGVASRTTLGELQRRGTDVLLNNTEGMAVPKEAMPRRFVLEWPTELRKSRGRSSIRVLDGISTDLERFYQDVVEQLVPFAPRAARLPKSAEPDVGDAGPENDVAGPERKPSDSSTVPTGGDV